MRKRKILFLTGIRSDFYIQKPIINQFIIVNNSDETIYGKIYLNEIRLTGVKKEPGTAFKINANFDFGDLFSIGGSYTETDANFHAL